MRTYDRTDPDPEAVRAHPWTVATGDPSARYHDLVTSPALIRTSLEDFLPWAGWPAIETFYGLLEWLNGPSSPLESNDCAFAGPAANESAHVSKALEATGRVMILWRALPLNLSRANIDWLREQIHRSLNEADPDFALGTVGITVCRVEFLTLQRHKGGNAGFQLMLSFWAWGDTDAEVMANLARTVQNLWDALRVVAKMTRKRQESP
jgi:hypothetical protein